MRAAALLVCLALAAPAAGPTADPAAVQEAEEAVCRQTETAKALDFWRGAWTVTDPESGGRLGKSEIRPALKGCALEESWSAASGEAGRSVFAYSALDDGWTQLWVTDRTDRPGGVKIKALTERRNDGTVIFQGTAMGPDGSPYLDRTLLIPREDGTVLQKIEISTDDGLNWRPGFEGLYSPPK